MRSQIRIDDGRGKSSVGADFPCGSYTMLFCRHCNDPITIGDPSEDGMPE